MTMICDEPIAVHAGIYGFELVSRLQVNDSEGDYNKIFHSD